MQGHEKISGDVARWPWALAAVTLLLGLSVSFWMGAVQHAQERRRVENDFVTEAEHLRGRVEREVGLFLIVLDSIRDLHGISEGIDAVAFEEFVTKGMEYQREILGGFGFAQFIPFAMRASYEADPSLRILELDPGGASHAPAYRPAGDRPGWYPLTYQYPENALGVPVGFDFGATRQGREALARMSTSGRQALDGAPPSVSGSEACWVFAPIFFQKEMSGPLAGFAVALFDPARIMERMAPGPSAAGLAFSLVDAMPMSPPDDPWLFMSPIAVADQIWAFRCKAGPDYLDAHRSRKPELVLGIGLMTTLLVTAFFVSLALRTHRIEGVVHQRTEDLHEANDRLRDEIQERERLEAEVDNIGRRERAQLGRDLHDSLGQKLTGAVYLSRALTQPDEPEIVAGTARELNSLLKDAVGQVRRIARGLAPVDLGDEGLPGALQGLVRETNAVRPGLCTLVEEGGDALRGLEAARATQLFHIAQEAVTNALRHAEAGQIRVALRMDGGVCVLTVEDDGQGLHHTTGSPQGVGLGVMRHRAHMIGGSFAVDERPGGGTRVTCSCDLRGA